MGKFEEKFDVGQVVIVRSALLWFLLAPNLPPGMKETNNHEVEFEAVVYERREHPCDAFWWGYTVCLGDGSKRRVLGYQLKRSK